MAISEDLRSVQAMLGSSAMASLNERQASLLRLACDNLSALAEQVEALEELPLANPIRAFPARGVPSILFRPKPHRHPVPLH